MRSEQKQRNKEKSYKALQLLDECPDPIVLMSKFNPAVQAKLISSGLNLAEIGMREDIPCLGVLNSAYGELMPQEWLKIQFNSLNDYAEQGRGITNEQLEELATLVMGEYYYLNMLEIEMFIARFKLGYYGEFYGVIGPMKIASALKKYAAERRTAIDIQERENERISLEKQREEWKKNSITREEYEILKRERQKSTK